MPFRSESQRRFMFAKHPGIAHRWAKEYGTPRNLPERVGSLKDSLAKHVRKGKFKKRSK